jgi:D-inositol-3-phosphate glycosyltransferase
VLIVSHYYPPHLGGIERVAACEARDLSMAGVEVSVLTSACGSRTGRYDASGGPTVHRVSAWNGFEACLGVPFPVFSPSLVIHSYRLVQWADIAHVHDSLYVSSWLAAAWCRVTRTPLIVTQHVDIVTHDWPMVLVVQRAVYASLGRMVVRTARRVAVVNSRVADFLKGLGVADSRITLLANSVDTRLFRPARPGEREVLRRKLGLPLGTVLALFVGRFVPKKGWHKLLMAAGEEYVLVLVGGDLPPGYAADGRCIFLGTLEPDGLSEVYRACDLFVLPSEAEGLPMTVQEAMSSGLPVITTDDPGYGVYGLDRDGVLLIEATVPAIRAALVELAGDPARRAAMSAYSVDFARRNFERQQHVEGLQSLLDDALGELHAKPAPTRSAGALTREPNRGGG